MRVTRQRLNVRASISSICRVSAEDAARTGSAGAVIACGFCLVLPARDDLVVGEIDRCEALEAELLAQLRGFRRSAQSEKRFAQARNNHVGASGTRD